MRQLICIGMCGMALFSISLVWALNPANTEWQPLSPTLSSNSQEKTVKDTLVTDIFCPEIKIFSPKNLTAPCPALIILPGGAYTFLAIKHEGEAVAQWAANNGMLAAVVKYRVTRGAKMNCQYPAPLLDARKAIRDIRENALTLGVDPNAIGIIGFSAGGHLASMAATKWNLPLEAETPDLQKEKSDIVSTVVPPKTMPISCRPDFAMLIYPVISMDDSITHYGSRERLFRRKLTPEEVFEFSSDKQVTSQTPPLFITHSKDDPTVSIQNSHNMATAARKSNVPVNFIITESGGHGYGMNVQQKPSDEWIKMALAWIKTSPWKQKNSAPKK